MGHGHVMMDGDAGGVLGGGRVQDGRRVVVGRGLQRGSGLHGEGRNGYSMEIFC